MPRKRTNPQDYALPKRVYKGRSTYEWKPAAGGTVRLCSLEASIPDIWQAYEQKVKEADEVATVQSLITSFFQSADFQELATETRKDYRKYAKKVLPVFGKMNVNKVKPEHVRLYMDKRGLSSRIQANREHAFFSQCFRFGYERGLCKSNPCKGVRKFKETSRKRYITDVEYNALYKAADPVIQVAMELAYLCCARQGDILAMRTSQILEDGIFIAQGKTGIEQIKEWSPRLRKAIALSKQLPTKPGVVSTFVVCQPDGSRFTRDGFSSRWRKTRSKVREITGLPMDFTFHDLKAKGISDLDGTLQEKQEISGHKDIRQTARYDRKVHKVRAVDSKKSK
ncbi:tyrosine-type recombinase/integrase [Celerinatantimonas diazotrophica]|uniref:Site-specific recombinase XerD n=1 Tax=Celerinatantimonas diazotrophica TaxID=412034 RepID=A0A4R1KH08_9GAMM|nr:tyrosine-type recombinase/integrase [Celerinatantimonas diazotrophica]TCK63994.1 site-specific recombinase XerD [Celerinatantimonas diazotrophica]CAG9297085.1 hypothetical protein CEDIAZO_02247 [Celerinatantimonas diazotrophica]